MEKEKVPKYVPKYNLYADYGVNIFHSDKKYALMITNTNYKHRSNLKGCIPFSRKLMFEWLTGEKFEIVSVEDKKKKEIVGESKKDPTIFNEFRETIWKEYKKLNAPFRKERFLHKENMVDGKINEKKILTEIEMEKLREQNKKGGRCGILIFVYYCGHGVEYCGHTHAVCVNAEKDFDTKETLLDIDILVGQLAAIPNTYVVSLFDCCREKANVKGENPNKLKRYLPYHFGGDSVRIYGTAAGTSSVQENSIKKGREWINNKGPTKVTKMFVNHATKYGFSEFPQGYSFIAFLKDSEQYQVEVKQLTSQIVHLGIGNVRKIVSKTYQNFFLMTEYEVKFLKLQFINLDEDSDNKTYSLEEDEVRVNLTVFGLNWPPIIGKQLKKLPKIEMEKLLPLPDEKIERKFKSMFNEIIQLDMDTKLLSFDEFLILFVRLQHYVRDWNDIIYKKHPELRDRELNDYVFYKKIKSLKATKPEKLSRLYKEIEERWNVA